MRFLHTSTTSKALRAAAITSLVGASLVGLSTGAQAAAQSLKVAPATGSENGGTVIAVTGKGFKNAAGVSQLNATTPVHFSTTACPADAGSVSTALPPSAMSLASATKIVATTPALPLTASKATDYNVCVYGSANSGALLGSTKFTAYPAPAITAAVSPVNGPAAGGGDVVITGTGFTKKSVVKFGSLESPKVTVSTDGTTITATAPAQAATGSAIAISVTTEGGTNATPGTATDDDYTYKNAVTVDPQFGLNSTATTITVTGVGFKGSAYSFSGTSKVLLVKGAYTKAVDATDGSTPAAVCGNVQVVSDTELTCDTPNSLSDAAYFVTVVDNATAAATPNFAVPSGSAAFTFAAF